MKNLTWQNPEQLFVAQELINKVKSKCCGIKDNEIVSAKHEQAKSIALLFYTGICAEDGKLTSRNIESLFKILQYECRYNYKETRKRVLNFKSYK